MSPQEINNKLTKIYEHINTMQSRCVFQVDSTEKDWNSDIKFIRAISGDASSIRNLVKELKI